MIPNGRFECCCVARCHKVRANRSSATRAKHVQQPWIHIKDPAYLLTFFELEMSRHEESFPRENSNAICGQFETLEGAGVVESDCGSSEPG